jgi:hypothetical protein
MEDSQEFVLTVIEASNFDDLMLVFVINLMLFLYNISNSLSRIKFGIMFHVYKCEILPI